MVNRGETCFRKIHLPYIAAYSSNLWDALVMRGIHPMKITPTVLDLAKHEIIDIMVPMIILPSSTHKKFSVRQSRQYISAVNDNAIDVVIKPPKKHARLTP